MLQLEVVKLVYQQIVYLLFLRFYVKSSVLCMPGVSSPSPLMTSERLTIRVGFYTWSQWPDTLTTAPTWCTVKVLLLNVRRCAIDSGLGYKVSIRSQWWLIDCTQCACLYFIFEYILDLY